jgi:hypothetical protein
MSFCNPTSGQWTNLTPDEFFAEYSNLTSLLPPDVSLWGLNLVTQFHDALSSDLQELLMADHTYVAPNLTSLTDRSKQLDAFRLLRDAAVCHFCWTIILILYHRYSLIPNSLYLFIHDCNPARCEHRRPKSEYSKENLYNSFNRNALTFIL